MAQDYTVNCFEPGDVGQVNLQEIENNFASLLSSFSGDDSPTTTVGGILWLDTFNNMLKIRNEADDGWLEVYDMANGRSPLAYQAPNHGSAATAMLVNVCYGTGTPPAAGGVTEGALFIKYTA